MLGNVAGEDSWIFARFVFQPLASAFPSERSPELPGAQAAAFVPSAVAAERAVAAGAESAAGASALPVDSLRRLRSVSAAADVPSPDFAEVAAFACPAARSASPAAAGIFVRSWYSRWSSLDDAQPAANL